MIEDIVNKVDYYQILNISNEATAKEVRKAFRQQSKINHPDKFPPAKRDEAQKHYILIIRAYKTLLDEDARRQYNEFLSKGIPWIDRYVNRYTSRYGAPRASLKWLLVTLLCVITAGQWCYRHYIFNKMVGYAKKTARYKYAVERAGGEDVEVEFTGLHKPAVWDLIPLRIITFPWDVSFFFWLWGVSYFGPQKTMEEKMMEEYNMSVEEIEEAKERQQEYIRKMKSSTKYKRYIRMMKKMGKT